MKFRTEILPVASKHPIQHDQPLLSIGSCFADHIVNKLEEAKFNVQNNPFGTTYNPLSIADQLMAILNQRVYEIVDVEKVNNQWVSFDHHGSFTRNSSTKSLNAIRESLDTATSKNGEYHKTILSFGTAWAWFLDEKVVNNCHQIPESAFDFRMLNMDEMLSALVPAMEKWQAKNPQNQFIVTVSPVRHTRSGLVENNRSKARLIELAHQIAAQIPNTEYYPAYELVLDDLRDYRFFDKTLNHPNELAIEYVWEHFAATYFDNATTNALEKFESFRKALWHRPRQTSGPAFDGHIQSLETKLEAWMQRWPDANWRPEMQRLNDLLKIG